MINSLEIFTVLLSYTESDFTEIVTHVYAWKKIEKRGFFMWKKYNSHDWMTVVV